MGPLKTFKVCLYDDRLLDSCPLPDSNRDNIVYQLQNATIWVPGVSRALKHGDIFQIAGDAAKAVAEYLGRYPLILETIVFPDVTDMALDTDGIELTVTWTGSDDYLTILEIKEEGGAWVSHLLDKGTNSMSIEVEMGTVQVRMRFTDGKGNYSPHYASSTVEVGPSEEQFIELGYSDLSDGCDSFLAGVAECGVGQLRLTPAIGGSYGTSGYKLADHDTPLDISFEFKHVAVDESPADSVYFYFYSNGRPQTESGEIGESEYVEGYVVGFSEYNHEISITYNGDSLGNIEYSFDDDTWYSARIVFYNGTFGIYVNNGLAMTATDTNFGDRTLDSDHVLLGIGGRTGAAVAEHYARNFSIEEYALPEEEVRTSLLGITSDNTTPNWTLYSIWNEEEDSEIVSFEGNYVRYNPIASALNTDNGLLYTFSFVETITEEGSNLTTKFQSINITTHEVTDIAISTGEPITLNQIYSMAYIDGNFILCANDGSNNCFFTVSLAGELAYLRHGIEAAFSGLACYEGVLLASVDNQAVLAVYNINTGEQILDEESNPVSISLSYGEQDLSDVGLQSLSFFDNGVPYFYAVITKNGGRAVARFGPDGVIQYVRFVNYTIKNVIFVIGSGLLGITGDSGSTSLLRNGSLYWLSSGLDLKNPIPTFIMSLTQTETDSSQAITWNPHDGYIYRLAYRSYSSSGEED